MSELLLDLEHLSKHLVRGEADLRDAKRCAAVLAHFVRKQSRRLIYHRFLRKLRSPKTTYELWPIGVILSSATFCGSLAFLAIPALASSGLTIFAGVVISATAGASLVTMFFLYPDDSTLVSNIANEAPRLEVDRDALRELRKDVKRLCRTVSTIKEERNQIIASAKHRREQILRQNWKAMRGIAWEQFLADVFRALGGEVETTNTVGDQGIDLVVQLGSRRIAVQAKGYHDAVSNSAVQEAVAGMRHYRCNTCAVITNSRFTKSAQELAQSNDCRLIGEDELPDLVRGNISL